MAQQRNKKKIYYLGCILFLIVISVVAILNGKLYTSIKISTLEKQRLGGRVECALQHEENPLKVDLTAFYNLYNDLQNFVYLEIYNQPLVLSQNNRKHFDYYTHELSENPDYVACLQISRNVVEKYQLKIDAGRMWDDTEFIMENRCIPVILGNGYSGIYEIGDVFEAEYLYESYDFPVIGFFEKNSVIYTGRSGFINVGQSIVMPSFSVHESALQTDSLKIHYANKTSGIIELDGNSYINDYRELEDKLKESGCGKYSLSLYPLYAHFQNRYGVSVYVAFGLLIVLWIICGVMILFLFHKLRNKYALSAKKYIWLCFIPILLYFFIAGNAENIKQYSLNIICIFLTEVILVIAHLLTEILFQKLMKRNET